MFPDKQTMNGKLLQTDGSYLLPNSYVLSKHDVLCGRGSTCYYYEGTRRFRTIIRRYKHEYERATGRIEKSFIIRRVVDEVRANSGLGGFVKIDPITKRASEVGDFQAREKTSQAFRDALEDQYQSSNASKRRRASSRAAKSAKEVAPRATPSDQRKRNILRSTIDSCNGTDMGNEAFPKNRYVSVDTEGLSGTLMATWAQSLTTSGPGKMEFSDCSGPNRVWHFKHAKTLVTHPPKPLNFPTTVVNDCLHTAAVDQFGQMAANRSVSASEDSVLFEKLCKIAEHHQTTMEDPFEPVPLKEVVAKSL